MRCTWLAFALSLLIPLCVLAQRPKPLPDPTNAERLAALKEAKVSFDDALESVKDHTVKALVFRIELTVNEGKPIYQLQMIIGNPTHYMTLDAVDGTLISQQDDGRFNKYGTIYRIRMDEPNIGLVQAILLAEAEYPEFKAYSSEAIVKGNVIFFEVRMASPTDTLHVTYTPQGVLVSATPPPIPIRK